ncbi:MULTISPECIES: MvaI/BcnI family restriction endonuclease [Enterococcus]|uniref:MvaI/BcnI family restriction endonuclease n=1 Tax=Enterococcus TaxID=1350 RepID=UPI0009BE8F06|nr:MULTISPECIES: MvaI/BcnI family restriction endonuclease [Enterococcus]MBA5267120.1 restriction endonuclease [Enterococcus hirae]MBK4751616.1 hypothetical protein [Enterococcus faecium]OQO43900.1 hypothetical protein BH733_13215 [Enterococcus hirae]
MIFLPNEQEEQVLTRIQKYNRNEFALVRLTSTMLNKSIIDASFLVRESLKTYNFVDYKDIKQGIEYKQIREGYFLATNSISTMIKEIKVSFYRPKTKKGDPRFWILRLKSLNVVKSGDLIYISVYRSLTDSKPKLILINLSNNSVDEFLLRDFFGQDKLMDITRRLLPLVKDISKKGYQKNYKGSGNLSPKDVGQTFEHLLNIKDNSSKLADFEETIEIKAKRASVKTNDTLFSMVPDYSIGNVQSSNEMIRKYGYPSSREKYKEFIDLYVTVGKKANNQGLFLEVDEDKELICQWHRNVITGEKTLTCAWKFKDVKERLYSKHRSTLWIIADEKVQNNTFYFHYNKAQLTRQPLFSSFITLVKSGDITFDWRGRVKPDGTKYKDKGHAWRMSPKNRELLFGEIETIILD